MIVYFADRYLKVIGQASTELPEGLVVSADKITEEVETGVSIFECKIHYDKKTRSKVTEYAEVGNHILYERGGESKLYTIIDTEVDTKKQNIYIYAEDDGMDLLNEVVGEYEADKAYAIDHYINKYAAAAGFVIGINEAKGLTRKLAWDGESTATARIASIATQFGGCEISFSFDVDGLNLVKKYINIYKERGKDLGCTLRLNEDIDSIITSKSISNIATALQSKGGTPDGKDNPITLKGYSYDDGDFFVDANGILKSRNALQRWNRYLWKADDTNKSGGHIVKQYSYDTTSQSELCSRTITELKKICDMEVNYKVDLKRLPDNVKIGDRVNIVDDAGELYLSSRILLLEISDTEQEYKATIGEHLIKSSGIHQKVIDLAAQFAQTAQSAARALTIANDAKTAAGNAQIQADSALGGSQAALEAATAAREAANAAGQSALQAQEKATAAEQTVNDVEKSVESLQTTITNAQTAAQQAQQAAQTAETKANEAQQAAVNAQTKANEAATASGTAQTTANSAVEKSQKAQTTANQAIQDAEAAATTAAAAKLDAENAQKDIGALSESLTTLKNTMTADYARKTDLTEAEAHLQSQISQNAGLISSTVSMLSTIDETTNDAQSQAEKAQMRAEEAQRQADQATADAEAAQDAADEAKQAANAAKADADAAKAAATTAQSVLDNAQAALDAAKADLETIQSRADATEEEIAAAQQAVESAQITANTAKTNADAAVKKAAEAQATADIAINNANEAQAAASTAASYAKIAQSVANEATNAAEAQKAADEAAVAAAEAQNTANSATQAAAEAKAEAEKAAQDAAQAVADAEAADAQATQAAADLVSAKQHLADVLADVDATEAEIAEAQAAVNNAQIAADAAIANATQAAAYAAQAAINAAEAQTAADTAKAAADQAQADAKAAQQAADAAQKDVNDLAVRVTTAETQITQNSEQIALRATKTEVSETLGGYYTKVDADAAIQVKADEITSFVSEAQNTADNATESIVAAQSAIKQLADSISSLVRDGTGGSMVKQDSNGLYYFDISGIEAGLSATANALNELDGIVLDINGQIDVLKSTAAALQSRTEYIRSYTDENDRPCLELGEGDSSYKAYITNEGIRFMDGTASPTIVTRQMLVIEKTMVRKEIQIGDDEDASGNGVWILKRRENGNCGLMWKELTN